MFKHTQSLNKCMLNDVLICDKHKEHLSEEGADMNNMHSKRAASLGHYNAITATAFIIGPIISGHVSDHVENGIFWLYALSAMLFLMTSG